VNNHNKNSDSLQKNVDNTTWGGWEEKKKVYKVTKTNYTKAEPEVMDMPELNYMVREGCYLLI
jgi:hypothetical protein